MYKADITVNFFNGGTGAKVIFASTLEQVTDDATYFVTNLVKKGKQIYSETGSDTALVVNHMIVAKKDKEI